MDYQTTVRPNAARSNGEAPRQAITRNMADLAHDVTHLAELQTRLFAADLKDASLHATVPSAALMLAATASLSCVPIVLMGLAWLIAELTALPVYAGFLIVAGAVLVLSTIVAVIAWLRLRRSLEAFSRSQEEFNRNMRWIKLVLRHRGTRGQPRC